MKDRVRIIQVLCGPLRHCIDPGFNLFPGNLQRSIIGVARHGNTGALQPVRREIAQRLPHRLRRIDGVGDPVADGPGPGGCARSPAARRGWPDGGGRS